MDLALRVVKAARARPAVGAAEHRAGAITVAHTDEFGTEQIRCRLPRQWNEFIASAAIVRSRSIFEPSAAHHRLRHARTVAQGSWKIVDDAVRIGIIGMREDFEFTALHAGRKHSPVRGMRPERCVGCGGGI